MSLKDIAAKGQHSDYCLILEGGGAKAAYQVGALHALEKAGFTFNAVSGASFGAVNGAMYCAGGLPKLHEFYDNFEAEDLFRSPELSIFLEKLNLNEIYFSEELFVSAVDDLLYFGETRKELSDHYHDMIAKVVDEKAIRESKMDFVFTVIECPETAFLLAKLAISKFKKKKEGEDTWDRLGCKKIYIDKSNCDIDAMPFMVAGGANYPFFKPVHYGIHNYLDGGMFDNMPYKEMQRRGYSKFVIIRTNPNHGDIPEEVMNDPNFLIIASETSLGDVSNFTKVNFETLIKKGYDDAKKTIEEWITKGN